MSSTTEQIIELVEPILDGMGFELVDVEYLCERGRWVLRLYIDKTKGVTLDDCALVSRELGDLIDSRDFVPHRYVLEVSSPGLDRPLRKEKDFIRVIGRKIKVRTVTPVKGRRNFTGYLRDVQNGTLSMDVEGQMVALAWSEIGKANLIYEFDT